MTTYNTGNAVPSTNPKDLYDNAQALDEAINSTADTFADRLGNEHPTLNRAIELGMASVGIYPDHASGVAAVGEGGYFCVPAALDTEWLVLYRVESGVAVEKKRLPSKVRIDELEGRVDTAESNIATLDGRLDTAESDINVVGGRATALEGRAATLEGRATALEGRAASAETNITALDDRLDDAEGDIGTLSGQTATAVTDIQSLKQRAGSLETRAAEAEGDINSLEGRLDDMAGLVAAAGMAAESAEQSASEALAKATEAAEDAAAAQASAQAAQDAADSAVAVVTGGTASLTPEPGKIPIADGSGRIDGDWVEFQQLGAGATQRTALAKLRDLAVSVLDLGAIGDGVSDDTDAFSRAAKEAPALDLFIPAYQDIPSASTCIVSVPAGSYVLSAPVDVGGRDVIWELQAGARIEGYEFLEGRLSRPGLRASAGRHFGILDHACSFTIRGNRDVERGPGVLGITHPNQLSVYGDRDSVSLYVDNEGPPAIVVAGASYSATTLICPTPVDVKTLRKGMIIDTAHTPNKYSGLITGWAADGSTVSVSAWYEVTGATGVEVLIF